MNVCFDAGASSCGAIDANERSLRAHWYVLGYHTRTTRHRLINSHTSRRDDMLKPMRIDNILSRECVEVVMEDVFATECGSHVCLWRIASLPT